MSVVTQALYDDKLKKYSVTSESADFLRAFMLSVTRVIVDLESPLVGLTVTSKPENLDTDIGVDAQYVNVVYDGVDYYLQDSGMWGSEDSRITRAEYEVTLARAHSMVMSDATLSTRIGTT